MRVHLLPPLSPFGPSRSPLRRLPSFICHYRLQHVNQRVSLGPSHWLLLPHCSALPFCSSCISGRLSVLTAVSAVDSRQSIAQRSVLSMLQRVHAQVASCACKDYDSGIVSRHLRNFNAKINGAQAHLYPPTIKRTICTTQNHSGWCRTRGQDDRALRKKRRR